MFGNNMGFVPVNGIDGIRFSLDSQDIMGKRLTDNILGLFIQESERHIGWDIISSLVVHKDSGVYYVCAGGSSVRG